MSEKPEPKTISWWLIIGVLLLAGAWIGWHARDFADSLPVSALAR